MALTDKLTNIADAIREKTGGTDALTLDAMAAAIAGIEAGGSIAMGSVTFAEERPINSGSYSVAHNLGFVPTHTLAMVEDTTALNSSGYFYGKSVAGGMISQEVSDGVRVAVYSGYSSMSSTTNNMFLRFKTVKASVRSATAETINVIFPTGLDGYIPAGSTVRWFVW